MTEEVEKVEELTADEIYELSKKLYEVGVMMKRLDETTSDLLINIASDTLDLINNSRFDKEESSDIDEIVKELDA